MMLKAYWGDIYYWHHIYPASSFIIINSLVLHHVAIKFPLLAWNCIMLHAYLNHKTHHQLLIITGNTFSKLDNKRTNLPWMSDDHFLCVFAHWDIELSEFPSGTAVSQKFKSSSHLVSFHVDHKYIISSKYLISYSRSSQCIRNAG
jgi:hypothetical protein